MEGNLTSADQLTNGSRVDLENRASCLVTLDSNPTASCLWSSGSYKHWRQTGKQFIIKSSFEDNRRGVTRTISKDQTRPYSLSQPKLSHQSNWETKKWKLKNSLQTLHMFVTTKESYNRIIWPYKSSPCFPSVLVPLVCGGGSEGLHNLQVETSEVQYLQHFFRVCVNLDRILFQSGDFWDVVVSTLTLLFLEGESEWC